MFGVPANGEWKHSPIDYAEQDHEFARWRNSGKDNISSSIASARVEPVHPSTLVSDQRSVESGKLLGIKEGGGLSVPITVVRTSTNNYIYDGNHRASVASILDDYIEAKIVDVRSVKKAHNPGQPREPRGTSKGGQFASKNGGGALTAAQAAEMGVADVFVGKVTPGEVQALRKAIADKEPQDVVLDKMAPIYRSIPSAGEPTLVLDKSGNPPKGFFADRKYNVGDRQVGTDEALDHLTRGAVGFAGKDGVALDRTATLLLGPSAAGKSTFAEHMAKKSRSAIVDPDEAKKIIRGYNGGLGANEVHEESSIMSRMVEKRLTRSGANMIIPTVGGNADGIARRVDRLQRAGYKVNVVDVHVDKHEATRRMAARALKTGRPIGRDYVINVGDKPSRTYEQVKTRTNGYARINANGTFGTDRVTESSGIDLFTTGEPVLGKSGGGGGELRGLAGRWGVPGPLRPEEGLSGGAADLQKVADLPGRGVEDVPLHPLRPEVAEKEEALRLRIKAVLSELGQSVSLQVKKALDKVAKAQYPDDFDTDQLLSSLDFSVLAALQADLEENISAVYSESGRVASSEFGGAVDADSLVDKVNARAVNWAAERAAELVSLDDGEPLLFASTRDMIRADIANGMTANLSTGQIASILEENYAFSEERATLIAATEITSANSMGALASYEVAEEMGVPVKKSWLTTEGACGICHENESAGAIPLDEEFPSGDMAPGAHPNCRCVVLPEVQE